MDLDHKKTLCIVKYVFKKLRCVIPDNKMFCQQTIKDLDSRLRCIHSSGRNVLYATHLSTAAVWLLQCDVATGWLVIKYSTHTTKRFSKSFSLWSRPPRLRQNRNSSGQQHTFSHNSVAPAT